MVVLSDEIIKVCKNGKWGCIDKTGKELIPCIYDEISLSSDIFIVKQNDKVGCLDKDGKVISFGVYDEIIEDDENLILVIKDYKYGWINRNGEEVIPCSYNVRVTAFSEGLVGVRNGPSYGYIDTTGKLVIPYIYDRVSEFYEGKALVVKEGKPKIIDKNGNEIIDLNYDWAENLEDDMAIVVKDNKAGMIDMSGKEIVPCIYEDMKIIKDNFIIVKKDGKYGVLKNGIEVISCIYENIDVYGGYDECITTDDGKYIIINNNLFGPYDDCVRDNGDGVFLVSKENKYGFLNEKGIESFPMFNDDGLIDYSNGRLYSTYYIKRDSNLYNKNKQITSNIMVVSKAGENIEIKIGNKKLILPHTEDTKDAIEELTRFDIIDVFQIEKINVLPIQYDNEWYMIKLK